LQGWIPVTGTHAKARGTYWLLTHNGDRYWPQNKIALDHDGRWSSSVHVNIRKYNRSSCIIVAKVGDFANAAFDDYKLRGRTTNYWEPIRLPQKSGEMHILDEVVVTILGSDFGGTTS
jgi:hypothetical protein